MTTVREARPEDVAEIVRLIGGLAEYEKLTDSFELTEERLTNSLFGENPGAFAHIAEHEGGVGGYAIWYRSFSTFLGCYGLYLEDLFVREDLRGQGYGSALLKTLAQVCVERDYRRFEWTVLDWNQQSIDFYESVGGVPMYGWTTYRMDGKALIEFSR